MWRDGPPRNPRSAVDAGLGSCLQIGSRWPYATDSDR